MVHDGGMLRGEAAEDEKEQSRAEDSEDHEGIQGGDRDACERHTVLQLSGEATAHDHGVGPADDHAGHEEIEPVGVGEAALVGHDR